MLIAVLAKPEIKTAVLDPVYGRLRLTILFDTSLSMKYAEDLKPNRLLAAKSAVREFVNMLWSDADLKGEYFLALIPFAGAAQPFFAPFTTSHEEFLSNLGQLDEKAITRKGTNVGAALRAYDMLLLRYPSDDKETLDIGMLFSDGGQEEGRGGEEEIIPRLMEELRDPRRTQIFDNGDPVIVRSAENSRRVVVYSVGIGNVLLDARGNRISAPIELVKRDNSGNFIDYYREDEKNSASRPLQSRLDEDVLRLIAHEGGGAYFHFSEQSTLLSSLREMILKERREIAKRPRYQYKSMREWLIVPAFVIFYFLFGYGAWINRIVKKISS